MRLETLKKSAEFRRVRGGARGGCDAFLIEGKPRPRPTASAAGTTAGREGPRVGFTVTKKLGGAVDRNRIRRRLKSVVRSLDADAFRAGYDYVVVARPGALAQPFASLVADFRRALDKIHRPASGASASSRSGPRAAPRTSDQPGANDHGAAPAPKRA